MTKKHEVSTDAYTAVVDKAVLLIQNFETSALRAHWELGAVVEEFLNGVSERQYGNNSMAKLADDLQTRGVLLGRENPVRILYWCRSIHAKLTVEQLSAYVRRGVTLTHVKALLQVPDGTVEEVMEQLFDENGKVVSTREAREAIDNAIRAATAKDAQASVREESKPAQPPAEMFVAAEQEDGAQVTTKTEKEKKQESDPVSALKALKQFDKSAEKTLALVSDVVLALETASKRGFDSDKAQQNFNKSLSGATMLVTNLLEVLPQLHQQMLKHE